MSRSPRCYMCGLPDQTWNPLVFIGEHWYCTTHEHYAEKYEAPEETNDLHDAR